MGTKPRKVYNKVEVLDQIGALEDKFCKKCEIKKEKLKISVPEMQNYCLNECKIGKKIRALGGVIEYGSIANSHFKAPDLTKEKYIELREKISDKEIREIYGISRVTLSRRKRAWNLTKIREYIIPSLVLKDMTPEKLRELSRDHTDKEIGEMYGVSRITVQKRRKKWGIKKSDHTLKDRFTLSEYKYLSENKGLKDLEIVELWEISESSLTDLKKGWGIAKSKKIPDLEELGLTYDKMLELVPNNSDKEIADMYGLYETTVTKHRKKLGISHLLRKSRYRIKPDQLKALLETDKTKIEIAEELGIHKTTLSDLIKHFSEKNLL